MNGLLYTVNKILSILKSHIGSRGDAHAVVSKETAGFMSAEQYEYFLSSSGNLLVIKDKDVLKLSPGKYLGSGMENMPGNDKGNFMIFVYDEISNQLFEEGVGRSKRIEIFSVYSGKHYVYSIRNGSEVGYNPSGWREIFIVKNLFEGEFKTINSEISTKKDDELYKFRYLRFHLIDGNIVEVSTPERGKTIHFSSVNVNSAETALYTRFMEVFRVNDTTLRITRNVQFVVSKDESSSQKNIESIVKIEGVQ